MRYRFAYSDGKSGSIEGVETISHILRTPVIHIRGQQSYLAGGPAAIRVIATDSENRAIAGGGSLRIELGPADQKPRALFTGTLNERGTADAQFRFPAGLAGGHVLRYVVDTPIGSAEFTQQVRLEDKVSILLTTEKPIYQPGQTIHVRALALDRANHEAVAGRKVTFELEDSRGNKVFKKQTQTSRFGVTSAEFALADEVNLGTYHLRALMESAGGGSANTAEIAVNVQRYVLPKFKVAVDVGGTGSKPKHGYRPGDHVTGTVRANYFFGKPVDGGEVTVKALGMDVTQFEAASAQGKTDREGEYRFDLHLPKYLAGRPLSQGAARILIEANVKDSAGHSESRGEPVTVSESSLLITVVPECGTLIPGIENQVFILTSYPDGKPASADISVSATGNPDQKATADAGGVAVVRLKTGRPSTTVGIEAADNEGNRASRNVLLTARQGGAQILLRPDRAVYRTGDRIELRLFSTKASGAAYVDVVKRGQTVLTRDVEIRNGQAELVLTAMAELAGALDINAYIFGADARPVADHRLVFVQPADELSIEATPDAPVYRPGDEARVRFRVTNHRGAGVQAALGLQVVDEAVFALAEKQPGFAKVFFYLEQEVMKPRYEIHSVGMPEVVETARNTGAEQRDRAAKALFSATDMVRGNSFETQFGRSSPAAKYWEYHNRYQSRFVARVSELSDSLVRAYRQHGGDLTKAAGPELRDAWGTNLRIEQARWDPRKTYTMRSAGADKRFGTADDLATGLEVQTRRIVGPLPPAGGIINLEVEHERGPFNGRAEIVGSVIDPMGASLPGATVSALEISSRRTRNATTDAGGQFTLSAVPPGTYRVQVSAQGFRIVSRQFVLEVRDRAVLLVTLVVGTVSETVTVTAMGDRVRVGGRFEGHRRRRAGRCDRRCHRRPRRSKGGGHAVYGRGVVRARIACRHIEGRFRRHATRALLLPRSPLHQAGDHHRRSRRSDDHDPPCRLHHYVAHGDDGVHTSRSAGQRCIQPEGVSGFLRRSRPPRHAHARRSCLHPGCRLQLLGRDRQRQPRVETGRLVHARRRRSGQDCERGIRPRRRLAVHLGGEPHRQIQTHAVRANERRCQPRRYRDPRDRGDPQRTGTEPGV
jgi:hypothetical protein